MSDVNALQTILQGINAINAKVDRLADRMDRVEARLEQIDARLDRVEARLDRVETRLDRVEARLDRIEARLDEHDRLFQEILGNLAVIVRSIAGSLAKSDEALAVAGGARSLGQSTEVRVTLLEVDMATIKGMRLLPG